MNYCLDARTAHDHFPGIGRYVFNLGRAMAPLLGKHEHLLLLRDPVRPSAWDLSHLAGGHVQVVDLPLSPFSLRQHWRVPQLLRSCRTNLYHGTYALMPFRPGVPAVVTIYDLIPLRYPHYFSPAQRVILGAAFRLATRRARFVIAVSRATAADVEKRLGVPASRIATIPLAAGRAFAPPSSAAVESFRQRLDLPAGYVLYAGSNRPHKNLARLLEAWKRLQPQPVPLVVAGPWDERYPAARTRAAELGLASAVRFLGRVPEADLPALYGSAVLLVLPSEYEGFGLPALEAMACGVPVACSSAGSLPEVAGGAAAFFDPLNPNAIAAAIAPVLADSARRAALARQGIARAADFSWENTARQTLSLYREAAG